MVVQCCRCGKTGDYSETNMSDDTDEVMFNLGDDKYICGACLIIQEALKAEGGTKNDSGKLRFDLVPTELSTLDAAIYTMGCEKYDDWNWSKGLKYSRVLAALLRHLRARLAGEEIDPESKLPHLAHARWNIGTLLYYDIYSDKYAEYNDLHTCDSELIKKLLHSEYPWRA